MAIRQFPDLSRPVHDIAGLPFDAVNLEQAVEKVIHAAEHRVPLFISTPNLNFLIAAQSDAAFHQSVRDSDLSLADGMPIVWLARILGVPIRERVAGSDLFEALCKQDRTTVKVYFFGGPNGAAQMAHDRVNAVAQELESRGLTPGVRCVGFESPGFGTLNDMSRPEIIKRINASEADFVVVALGARKGQEWIQRNRAQLKAPVISHLGAVVNMTAGTIARAPQWLRNLGLEWLWRIKEEPQLWRRYGADGIAMIRLLFSYVLPQVWLKLVFRRRINQPQVVASPELFSRNGRRQLVLKGIWSGPSIDVLRSTLNACVLQGARVSVDVSQAEYIDSAIRGLLDIVSDISPQPAAETEQST